MKDEKELIQWAIENIKNLQLEAFKVELREFRHILFFESQFFLTYTDLNAKKQLSVYLTPYHWDEPILKIIHHNDLDELIVYIHNFPLYYIFQEVTRVLQKKLEEEKSS